MLSPRAYAGERDAAQFFAGRELTAIEAWPKKWGVLSEVKKGPLRDNYSGPFAFRRKGTHRAKVVSASRAGTVAPQPQFGCAIDHSEA